MLSFKSALLVLSFGLVGLIMCCAGEELYSSKYDYVDVDAILAVPRQRAQYYRCFSGEGRCLTPDAKFFKDHLREAIVTNCRRCTEKQKKWFNKVSIYYAENEPEKYKALVARAIADAREKKASG
ncbi:ejaculatory bulb-specific protein 3-like [Venturia canescens]|uniref:ejaculatory bulb-specific protein 3-like n=1 Tax=Venturia canescens TaxID=32260 RepID=UPI001C9C6B12|nr:ejaculatory bulb-specific protein 3-like [Venturia canescens]